MVNAGSPESLLIRDPGISNGDFQPVAAAGELFRNAVSGAEKHLKFDGAVDPDELVACGSALRFQVQGACPRAIRFVVQLSLLFLFVLFLCFFPPRTLLLVFFIRGQYPAADRRVIIDLIAVDLNAQVFDPQILQQMISNETSASVRSIRRLCLNLPSASSRTS